MIRRPPRSTLFPLHDALPISDNPAFVERLGDLLIRLGRFQEAQTEIEALAEVAPRDARVWMKLGAVFYRSEEHTSELQSQSNLVCRLLLEKKKKKISTAPSAQLLLPMPIQQPPKDPKRRNLASRGRARHNGPEAV